MHILHVVGARPNFMKAAPVMRALARCDGIRQTLVHTGQHYDDNMSEVFFRQLYIPEPDINLGVGSGSHAWQTAQIMSRFEAVVLEHRPDLVLVYGDVNSTLAAALVCVKLLIPVGHVEAGLRSFDRTMPEEFNRLLTDQIADLLFTPSADADENLLREGIPPERIHRVGNVMIDTLVRLLPKAENRPILAELGLVEQKSRSPEPCPERSRRGSEGTGAGEQRGQGSKGARRRRRFHLCTHAPVHLRTVRSGDVAPAIKRRRPRNVDKDHVHSGRHQPQPAGDLPRPSTYAPAIRKYAICNTQYEATLD